MSGIVSALGRAALFRFDPETAHGLSIRALRSGLPLACPPRTDARLAVTVAGLSFPNPLGMAAGYDKNAEVPDALLSLGFGFAEVGTITPLPQSGNPKPRIFRLAADEAVINRLGFNNEGHEAAIARLMLRRGRKGIVGVNIGANKDSADRMADYELGVRRFGPLASYLTANISSPNTPGLRNLQGREALRELLGRVVAARTATREAAGRAVPVFLKIAPDLAEEELPEVAGEVLSSGIDGIIVSNTTLRREGLKSPARGEQGGLSGRPLFALSTAVLARIRKLVGPDLAIIAAGGVWSAGDVVEKVRAGADLVQVYTGMIYEGPGMAGNLLRGLSAHLDDSNAASLSALRDSGVEEWAARDLASI